MGIRKRSLAAIAEPMESQLDVVDTFKSLARHAVKPALIASPFVFLAGFLSGGLVKTSEIERVMSVATVAVFVTAVVSVAFLRMLREAKRDSSDEADTST